MKKYIKYLIIVITIIILLTLLNKLLETPTDEKIISYITSQGYKLNPTTSMYYKKISKNNILEYSNYVSKKIAAEYEINYFDNLNYKLIKEKLEYSDEIETSLTENYSYHDNLINFTYRINHDNNNVNAIYKGTYDIKNNKFTCNKEFSYGLKNTSIQNTICKKVEYDLKTFSFEVITFITDSSYLDYMKNK